MNSMTPEQEEEYEKKIEELYERANDGIFLLSPQGCGYYFALIFRGPAAGQMCYFEINDVIAHGSLRYFSATSFKEEKKYYFSYQDTSEYLFNDEKPTFPRAKEKYLISFQMGEYGLSNLIEKTDTPLDFSQPNITIPIGAQSDKNF